MTKMKTMTAIGIAALALSVTACSSASTPVSPTSVAGASVGNLAGETAIVHVVNAALLPGR